jgi:hypothetical protein
MSETTAITSSVHPGDVLNTWTLDNATLSFSSLSLTNEATSFNFSSCRLKENKCSFLSNSTAIGNLFQLKYQDSQLLRFYLSPPSTDWRSNQTYAWKISQSWITQSSHAGYFFWNIENYINSEMIIPVGFSAFSCDSVELSYFPSTVVKRTQKASLIATDFWIGFAGGKVYHPCGIGKCRAINGNVTCGHAIYWQYAVVAIVAVCCMLCWVLDILRSRHASLGQTNYSQILPDDGEDHGIEMHKGRRNFQQVINASWDDEDEG